MRCVVLVRGKKATQEMTELAESISIVLMESDMRMYDACGGLFSAGLVGPQCSDMAENINFHFDVDGENFPLPEKRP